jgi:hypothetical protein
MREPQPPPALLPLLPSLTNPPRARRLTVAVTVALLLGALVTALLGPAQTLAQTRKPACSSSAARAEKAKHAAHPCAIRKAKGKGAGKHRRAKKRHRSSSAPAIPASCENGAPPVLSGGSFSCEDGSEPQCVDGAAPKASRNGKLLLCPAAEEGEAGSGEAECEEEEPECTASADTGEQACEASSSAASCEAEAEG